MYHGDSELREMVRKINTYKAKYGELVRYDQNEGVYLFNGDRYNGRPTTVEIDRVLRVKYGQDYDKQ